MLKLFQSFAIDRIYQSHEKNYWKSCDRWNKKSLSIIVFKMDRQVKLKWKRQVENYIFIQEKDQVYTKDESIVFYSILEMT